MISESRAGDSDAGLRPSETATSDVATAAPLRAAQLGHRVHVLALGRGGAVVARAEEADRELGLGDRRGHGDVGGGDGGGGGDVPGDLAVGLHEVRVAVGGLVEGVEGGRLELDVLPLGRGDQRAVGGLAVQPVDAQVAEQPLRVALRRAEHGGQVREPRADDDQRRALLGELVAGGADGRDVVGLHVLHLVDEQRDPAADVGGDPGGVAEQLDQVDLHVAGVGPPGGRRDVDARLPPVADLRRPAGRRPRWANALTTPSTSSIDSWSRCRGPSSRSAMCSAEETGRRSDWSGRASILPVPQPREIAAERSWLSSTVLPTPRSPVSTSERSGRPCAIRSRTTSKADSSVSRPASSGGRWPAPGA